MTLRELVTTLLSWTDSIDEEVKIRIVSRGDGGVVTGMKFVGVSMCGTVPRPTISIEQSDITKATTIC